jgi:uncharacterized membrane protein YeaQ/YmgE (transglycosylase-associated protein family)
MSILGSIVAGLVVGLLARVFLPGRQNISLVMTTIIGIIAALVGWWLAGVLGVRSTSGVDWIRWIISIVLAGIGIVAYGNITGKRA